ncbi:TBC1 domain family member 20 [Venturia canescens]|uniref:TBC1 domain family member 20 n=1 Tax=Venturia canescens TaxID=32260 RepID=UPI001C9BEADE|nr:TBC1 domain family member 20 [Venturia canescens]
MPNSMDNNHNPKARRRNVNEELKPTADCQQPSNENKSGSEVSSGGISNGRVPRIPSLVDLDFSTKETEDNLFSEADQLLSDHALTEETPDYEAIDKMVAIKKVLQEEPLLNELRLLSCGKRGLVNDDTRRKVWPRLLGLDDEEALKNDQILDITTTRVPDDVYQQILKDVARSGGHLAVGASEKELENFQSEMTQLICWVLHRHSRLNYYQGYNDIAATVLLVMGLQRSLQILERISLDFLERFMERTMEKVNQELFYIFALLHRIHPMLLVHLENVELFPHFALAEYTTWYAHKYAENRKLLHRLFDFFLGSPPLMPLYLSTVIVAHRDTEIFNTTPDMGHTHKVLCTLPDDLPFEKLLIDAKKLYDEYPPESIINDVRDFDQKRRCKEQEWKAKAEASRKERERQRQLKVAIPSRTIIPYPRLRSYRTITVVTILAIGIYAFFKTNNVLN